MVQFKKSPFHLVRSPGPENDEYWKLDSLIDQTATKIKEELGANNFYCKPSASKKRVLTLHSRLQQGHLSYEDKKFSTDELRRFCAQRQLRCGIKLKRNTLIRILEAADESATFTRFFDLPPELRNQIYSIHFASFPDLTCPTTPPIARASRQLRQETLFLVYQSCAVVFVITMPRPWPRREHAPPRNLTHLSEDYLGDIRNFSVSGPVVRKRRSAGRRVYVEWQVDLNAKKSEGLMSAGRTSCSPENIGDGFEKRRDRAARRLKTVLEGIAAREGAKKLKNSDGSAFMKVFESTGTRDEGE